MLEEIVDQFSSRGDRIYVSVLLAGGRIPAVVSIEEFALPLLTITLKEGTRSRSRRISRESTTLIPLLTDRRSRRFGEKNYYSSRLGTASCRKGKEHRRCLLFEIQIRSP